MLMQDAPQDGKLYLLDFGRLYPPESPVLAAEVFPPLGHQRSVFFKMLRPELVGSHEVPLCSDVFTGWLRNDPLASEHNTEVRFHLTHTHFAPLNLSR